MLSRYPKYATLVKRVVGMEATRKAVVAEGVESFVEGAGY